MLQAISDAFLKMPKSQSEKYSRRLNDGACLSHSSIRMHARRHSCSPPRTHQRRHSDRLIRPQKCRSHHQPHVYEQRRSVQPFYMYVTAFVTSMQRLADRTREQQPPSDASCQWEKTATTRRERLCTAATC